MPGGALQDLDAKIRGLGSSISPSAKAPSQVLYSKLERDNAIRLLEILPRASSEDVLHCRLKETILTPYTQYEALSYTWGKPEPKRQIECNGALINVNPNLHAALERLVQVKKSTFVWIDALCINQDDLEERSHQVKQMANIYIRAQRVIVWLGNDDGELASAAFKIIQETVDFYNSRTLVPKLDVCLESLPPPPYADGAHGPDTWKPVNTLLNLPWFNRVWTQQEIGLAGSAILCWGAQSLQWSALVEFLVQYHHIPAFHRSYSHTDLAATFLQYHGLWSCYRGSDRETWRYELPFTRALSVGLQKNHTQLDRTSPKAHGHLLRLLEIQRAFEASDARDHIFAFLGHPSTRFSPEGPFISPDYDLTTQAVYTKAATAILNQMQSLMLLSTVEHTARTLVENDIPSWVPRWNVRPQTVILGVITSRRQRYYDASKTKTPAAKTVLGNAAVAFTVSRNILTVKGIQIDGIERTFLADANWQANSKTRNSGSYPIEALLRDFALSPRAAIKSRYDNFAEAVAYTLRAGLSQRSDEPPLDADTERNWFSTQFREYLLETCNFSASELQELGVKDSVKGSMSSAASSLAGTRLWAAAGRRFFVTASGYVGLGPGIVEPGDVCCVLFGAMVPMVLRPAGSGGGYRLVGEAYIHGVMRGEVVDLGDGCAIPVLDRLRTFELV